MDIQIYKSDTESPTSRDGVVFADLDLVVGACGWGTLPFLVVWC